MYRPFLVPTSSTTCLFMRPLQIYPPERAGMTCTMSPSRSVASSPPRKRKSSSFTKRLRCERRRPCSSRARSARESAVGAVEQYPHMSTTNGSGQDGHRLARTAVEAPLEQRTLGRVLGQLERARVGRARVRRSAKRAEELSARRVEQVVAGQLPRQSVDLR